MKRLIWYDLQYLQNIGKAACFCGGLVGVTLCVAGIAYKTEDPWAWLLLLPGTVAATFVWWLLRYGLRERAVLKAEAAAGLNLPEALLPETSRRTLYGNEEWLILAGKLAVHRSFLERVTIEITDKGVHWGPTYWTVFQLKNGKRYKIHVDSASTGRKIKNWFDN